MIPEVGVGVTVLNPAAGPQLAQAVMQTVGGNLPATGEREGAPDHSFGNPAKVADSPQLIDQRPLVSGPRLVRARSTGRSSVGASGGVAAR